MLRDGSRICEQCRVRLSGKAARCQFCITGRHVFMESLRADNHYAPDSTLAGLRVRMRRDQQRLEYPADEREQ
jgi:hypothetical protein